MNEVDVMNGKTKTVKACQNAIILYDKMRNDCKIDRKGKTVLSHSLLLPLLYSGFTLPELVSKECKIKQTRKPLARGLSHNVSIDTGSS